MKAPHHHHEITLHPKERSLREHSTLKKRVKVVFM